MKEVLGDYYSPSGNFYMTTQLHDASVDLLTEAETYRLSGHKTLFEKLFTICNYTLRRFTGQRFLMNDILDIV